MPMHRGPRPIYLESSGLIFTNVPECETEIRLELFKLLGPVPRRGEPWDGCNSGPG